MESFGIILQSIITKISLVRCGANNNYNPKIIIYKYEVLQCEMYLSGHYSLLLAPGEKVENLNSRHNFLLVVFTPQTASCGPELWVSSSIKTMHYQRNCDTLCPCGLAVYRCYANSALFSLKHNKYKKRLACLHHPSKKILKETKNKQIQTQKYINSAWIKYVG